MKSKAICLFLFLVSWILSIAQYDLAATAYTDYVNGKLDEAASKYKQIENQGQSSADIYYNLGCIYLKQNKISEARLSFEKALRLDPSSGNIKEGLRQVRSKIEPSIESLPPFILYKWFVFIRDLSSSKGWGILLLVGTLILSLLGTLYALNKINLKLVHLTIFAGWVCILGLFFISRIRFESSSEFVVIMNQPLRVAPEENSQELIPLGAGTKVTLKDSLQAWYKVTLENNDDGWLPKVVLNKI